MKYSACVISGMRRGARNLSWTRQRWSAAGVVDGYLPILCKSDGSSSAVEIGRFGSSVLLD